MALAAAQAKLDGARAPIAARSMHRDTRLFEVRQPIPSTLPEASLGAITAAPGIPLLRLLASFPYLE